MEDKIKEFNSDNISIHIKYENGNLQIIACDYEFKAIKNLTQQFTIVVDEIMKELSCSNISRDVVIINLFLIYHNLNLFTPLDDYKKHLLFVYKHNDNIYLDYNDGLIIMRRNLNNC